MKKSILTLLISIALLSTEAQRISKVTISETGTLQQVSVELDENVVVNLTDAGEVKDWGIEIYKGRTDRYQERLEPYTGRVEYYTEYDNEAFRGKVKYIGQKLFTYYASFDEENLRGKLKSIGSASIEYFSRYDEKELQGKMKKIGMHDLQYYSSFDAAMGGKLKTVGGTTITYYTNFDDVAFRGKIKSIGQSNFTYYSSYDRKELRGIIRQGWRIQYVNGVKFFIK